jgi:hypothetical protein
MINIQNRLDELHQKQYDPALKDEEKAVAKREEDALWNTMDVFPIVIIIAMVMVCAGIVLYTS